MEEAEHTRDGQPRGAFMERGERELLAFSALRDGPNVGVAASFVDCGPIDLQSQAIPRFLVSSLETSSSPRRTL